MSINLGGKKYMDGFYFFLRGVVLEVEHRASHLLGGYSTT
jgi:hypothetical protein